MARLTTSFDFTSSEQWKAVITPELNYAKHVLWCASNIVTVYYTRNSTPSRRRISGMSLIKIQSALEALVYENLSPEDQQGDFIPICYSMGDEIQLQDRMNAEMRERLLARALLVTNIRECLTYVVDTAHTILNMLLRDIVNNPNIKEDINRHASKARLQAAIFDCFLRMDKFLQCIGEHNDHSLRRKPLEHLLNDSMEHLLRFEPSMHHV